MVCGRAWLAPFVVSLVQAGMAAGSFSGALADRFGRRPAFLWTSALQVIFTLFASLSWDYYSYAIAMLLTGCAQLVNYVVAFVVSTEVIAVRWRNFISISSFFSFAVGYCIEPGLGYMFPNWRHFLWAISGFSLLFYLPSFWLFPESARWLLIKGRSDEGIKELKKMARMNGSDFDVEAFVKENLLEDEIEAEKKTASIKETFNVLFRSKITARYLSAFFLWSAIGLIYYGISLYSTSFSKNRHLHLLFSGLSEFPALVLGYYAVGYIGRPRSAFCFMLFCGISSIVLPFMTAAEISVLRIIIAMIGKGAISAVFYVGYFLTAEITPTLQRSSAMSIASFCARIGGVTTPFLAFAGKVHRLVPNLTMGAVAILSGVLCVFYVPETEGVQLPDTTEEAENNRRIYRLRMFRSLAVANSTKLPPTKEKSTTEV